MAGIPYMGSKRKLAHRIVDVIFNRHNSEKFYDLFGGGGLFRQTAVIRIPILDFYAGDYRLEYDGKYVTLFGKDKNYKGFKFNDEDDDWFEEMVLIPVVEEIRNASPKIIEVTDTDIVVDLGFP